MLVLCIMLSVNYEADKYFVLLFVQMPRIPFDVECRICDLARASCPTSRDLETPRDPTRPTKQRKTAVDLLKGQGLSDRRKKSKNAREKKKREMPCGGSFLQQNLPIMRKIPLNRV